MERCEILIVDRGHASQFRGKLQQHLKATDKPLGQNSAVDYRLQLRIGAQFKVTVFPCSNPNQTSPLFGEFEKQNSGDPAGVTFLLAEYFRHNHPDKPRKFREDTHRARRVFPNSYQQVMNSTNYQPAKLADGLKNFKCSIRRHDREYLSYAWGVDFETIPLRVGSIGKKRRVMSLSAKDYWEHRYLAGGNSGAGSKGGLLSWKADIVNAIIRENGVKSCLELGSGDGKFANLLNLKSYIGYDISPSAITLANQHIYKPNFKVKSKTPFVLRKFDIAISIDVIYHILDKKDFDNHMTKLFSAAKRLVVIYSWPQKPSETMSAHIAFNDFRSWAELQAPGWQLVDHIPNKFPFDEDNPNHTSRSEFFVYRRRMFVNRWL